MSFSAMGNTAVESLFSSFPYRNVGQTAADEHPPYFAAEPAEEAPAEPGIAAGVPHSEVERLLADAREQTAAEVRQQMQQEAEAHRAELRGMTEAGLRAFLLEQKKYFAQAESEIVHLSLAIARRILHREAQVDPMLIAGVVRVALEKLSSGSTVTVRVSPQQSEFWRAYRASASDGLQVLVVEDLDMKPSDCLLETEMGSADFSIEAQLKEVERGFCDLLALRPQIA